jgi:hypothetical protein
MRVQVFGSTDSIFSLLPTITYFKDESYGFKTFVFCLFWFRLWIRFITEKDGTEGEKVYKVKYPFWIGWSGYQLFKGGEIIVIKGDVYQRSAKISFHPTPTKAGRPNYRAGDIVSLLIKHDYLEKLSEIPAKLRPHKPHYIDSRLYKTSSI